MASERKGPSIFSFYAKLLHVTHKSVLCPCCLHARSNCVMPLETFFYIREVKVCCAPGNRLFKCESFCLKQNNPSLVICMVLSPSVEYLRLRPKVFLCHYTQGDNIIQITRQRMFSFYILLLYERLQRYHIFFHFVSV